MVFKSIYIKNNGTKQVTFKTAEEESLLVTQRGD